MSENVQPPTELLAAHASWVHRLARRLARDEGAAEDLVQDAWVAALRSPEVEVRAPRRWLAGLLSNLARRERRGTVRRERRESRVAEDRGDSAGVDGPDTALERAQLGRALADEVLALDEPFRTALLLRFYEDLPPREIARRLDVPVRTVNSRLERGLARLRERWRRRHAAEGSDGMRSLLLLVRSPDLPGLPGLPEPSGAAAPATLGTGGASLVPFGAVLVNTKLVLGGVLLLGGGSLYLLWSAHARNPEPLTPAAPVAKPEPVVAGARPEPSPAGDPAPERSAVQAAEPEAPPFEEAADTTVLQTVRGRVLDVDARPVVGATVAVKLATEPAARRLVSGTGGVFELELPPASASITCVDPHLVTLLHGVVRPGSRVEPLVVVAEHRVLAGRVVDEDDRPVPRTEVRLEPPPDFRTRFEAVLDATGGEDPTTVTDAEGGFVFERAPRIWEAELAASQDGFETGRITAPPGDDRELLIRLSRPKGAMVGVVVDAGGRPAPGARVSLGAGCAVTDESGTFHLELAGSEDAFELTALLRGHLPGRLSALVDPRTGAPVWPEHPVLTLGGPPLAITGRVEDPEGRPLEGILLWVEEPTPFGILGDDLRGHVEFILATDAGVEGADEISEAYWRGVSTDAGGRFRLEGLLERDYTLRLMNPETLRTVSAGPYPAGSEATLTLSQGELRPLSGRVVTSAGQAVEGVQVELTGAKFGGIWEEAEVAVTNAEGRFAFEPTAGDQLMLWIRGDDVVPKLEPIAPGSEDREIVVSVRCHLKVDLEAQVDLADGIRVLDADGTPLTLHRITPTGVTMSDRVGLVGGRTITLGVEDRARELVLEKDGEEVRRVPLVLVPGRVNLVTP